MTLNAATTDPNQQLDELLEAMNPDSDDSLTIEPNDRAVEFLRNMDFRREGGAMPLHMTVPQRKWLADIHAEAVHDAAHAREASTRRQQIESGQGRQPKTAAVWVPDLGLYAEPV